MEKEQPPVSEPVNARPNDEPRRTLSSRHLEFIAVGGTIGTGLFVGSGVALATAGPLGALLAYIIVGVMVYFVVDSLGEMATFLPVSGSFNHYAGRFVDPAFGFTCGWNYYLIWALTPPAEMVACSSIIQFWLPGVDAWIWSLVMLISLYGINLIGSRGFAETELYLSALKVIAIVAFVILGVVIDLGGIRNGDSEPLRGKNWHIDGAPFKDGFQGFFTIFSSAFYAYSGTELVGITAGDAKNPRKSVPRAINGTFWRIALFYCAALAVVGLLVANGDDAVQPVNSSSTNPLSSPFTIAFLRAGIRPAAHIINAVILAAVFSAGNSCIYAASRTLASMAKEGKAPRFLADHSSWDCPVWAVTVTSAIGGIAFLATIWGNGVVFTWIVSVTGVSSLLIWMAISVTHLRFRRAYVLQGYKIEDLPYVSRWYPYGSWISLTIAAVLLVGIGYSGASHDTPSIYLTQTYIGLPFFFLLWIGYKLVYKTKVVPLAEMDLVTDTLREREIREEKSVPVVA
ncbi:hypothetical protein HDU87_001425 [Geranomyces variabilis]|uniref:Amino acid permease/ SLC12A domain-containing protein n=1 Tax=Geranomyces variabilis TaxID=109894 RepID=A0AAD5XLW1_9FUNG|nr:hypothetical protein HDU87_001425 [Geranomyces variabilis]